MSSPDHRLTARREAIRSAQTTGAEHAVSANVPNAVAAASFELPRQLTVATVQQTRVALSAWLAQRPAGQAWCLAAAGVEQIDAAGVQLLLALASRAAQDYVRLRLFEPSAALIAACAELGLAEVLLEVDGTGSRR